MTTSPEAQEIVIITGASTGMGAATARELARQGFHVLAGVRRDQDADAIRGPGVEPLIIDITNPAQIRALATRVQEDPQGRPLRALINNAGVAVNAPVEVFSINEWRSLFEVNFFGHIVVTQALLPDLIRSRGRIINISSVGGKIAMATMVLTVVQNSRSKPSVIPYDERWLHSASRSLWLNQAPCVQQ
jgi:NAD(P)-dependent dehydrogenase (short-subunit alcohol dehydrogenase family)